MKKLTIAIDGHASTGKSSIAKEIALKYGYIYINSGSMYRAVTLFAIKNNLAFQKLPIDLPKVEQHLIWHASDDNEGPHLWMKDLLIEAFAEAQKV